MSDAMNRVVLVVGALVIAAALYLALSRSDTGVPDQLNVTGVERVFPPDGARELRQTRVGADLATGFTGVLVIDGVEIPEDQLDRMDQIGEVSFMPGEGKVFSRFQPGEICATALFWPVSASRAAAAQQTWCFDVA